MVNLENQSGTKRIMSQLPVEYPLPHNLGQSVYKNDYYKVQHKNLRVPKFNREIEADRIFSKIKEKNGFASNVETTCHTDFRRHKSHSVYKGITKPEVKEMLQEQRALLLDPDLKEMGNVGSSTNYMAGYPNWCNG